MTCCLVISTSLADQIVLELTTEPLERQQFAAASFFRIHVVYQVICPYELTLRHMNWHWSIMNFQTLYWRVELVSDCVWAFLHDHDILFGQLNKSNILNCVKIGCRATGMAALRFIRNFQQSCGLTTDLPLWNGTETYELTRKFNELQDSVLKNWDCKWLYLNFFTKSLHIAWSAQQVLQTKLCWNWLQSR